MNVLKAADPSLHRRRWNDESSGCLHLVFGASGGPSRPDCSAGQGTHHSCTICEFSMHGLAADKRQPVTPGFCLAERAPRKRRDKAFVESSQGVAFVAQTASGAGYCPVGIGAGFTCAMIALIPAPPSWWWLTITCEAV